MYMPLSFIFFVFVTKKAQMVAHSRQFHTPYTGLSPDAPGHTPARRHTRGTPSWSFCRSTSPSAR